MNLEIERKFLVTSDAYKINSKFTNIRQAYLSVSDNMAIRIRLEGINASINIKFKKTDRINHEFEYMIPIDEARSLFKMSPFSVIEKTRYIVKYEGRIWEVDEFKDSNRGLIIAEIELNDEDELFELPPWIGKEVTTDYRYLNSSLIKNPFNSW